MAARGWRKQSAGAVLWAWCRWCRNLWRPICSSWWVLPEHSAGPRKLFIPELLLEFLQCCCEPFQQLLWATHRQLRRQRVKFWAQDQSQPGVTGQQQRVQEVWNQRASNTSWCCGWRKAAILGWRPAGRRWLLQSTRPPPGELRCKRTISSGSRRSNRGRVGGAPSAAEARLEEVNTLENIKRN